MSEEEIVAALLSAFGTEARLGEFMRFKMGRSLAEVATGDNLREVVAKLVETYARQGEIWTLVANAALAYPNNELLSALVTRGPRTQSRGREAHRMDSRREYTYSGEDDLTVLQSIVTELSKQVQNLDKTFARWEEAAKYAAESSNNRIKAIEKEVELLRTRQATLEQEMMLTRENARLPRQMMLSTKMQWGIFSFMLAITALAGSAVYLLGWGG
jgi:exonuclease VII small subunit